MWPTTENVVVFITFSQSRFLGCFYLLVGMPTVLQSEVRSLIEKIINDNAGESEHIPIDIYRTLRDESTLYFERQRLWDSIDSDPFDHFQKNDALLKQLERAKVCIAFCLFINRLHSSSFFGFHLTLIFVLFCFALFCFVLFFFFVSKSH